MIHNLRLQDNTLFRQIALTLFAVGLGVAGGLAIVSGNPIVPFVALAALVALPWLITRPYADILLVVADYYAVALCRRACAVGCAYAHVA